MISGKRNVFGTKGRTGLDFMVLVSTVWWLCLTAFSVSATTQADPPSPQPNQKLRFGQNGEFKILQVADMHYANGKSTPCLNVLPSQNFSCSDLNTTVFINRMIQAERPNLIVFTGNQSCFQLSFHLISNRLIFWLLSFKKMTFSLHSFEWNVSTFLDNNIIYPNYLIRNQRQRASYSIQLQPDGNEMNSSQNLVFVACSFFLRWLIIICTSISKL